ncbi:MAG: TetR/AcrR family transcriptional regulator [Flavobacteriales bacterium]|nr:TetR/AcrR family transcriptional regulator [Flavobacteriales bacterium]
MNVHSAEIATDIPEKKQAIIEATLALTSSHGLAAVSTALISKEAGVGMGTLYRYFDSKEELLHSIFIQMREQMLQIIFQGIGSPELKVYQRFQSIIITLTKYYVENRLQFQFLQKYSDSSYMKDSYLDESAIILDPIATILASGDDGTKFKNLPVHMIFGMIYGPVLSIIQLAHQKKIELDEEKLTILTKALWDSITEPDETIK